jgi:hypothetical protein
MSIGISTFAALQLTDIPIAILAKAIYTATDKFPLHAVPLFILAGALMEVAGWLLVACSLARCPVPDLRLPQPSGLS